uniref:ATP-binding cassette sub-family C member 4 n=1 Tax=Lepeophtheirus salmonis TaxID=72036 RepID=A0A0K2UZH0_LEPSM
MDIEEKVNLKDNKRSNANILSKIFFIWVLPLLRDGQNKAFDIPDLPSALTEDKSRYLSDNLEREWKKELEKGLRYDNTSKKRYSPSLLRALIRTFGSSLGVYGAFSFIEECVFRLLQPLAISQIVLYFSNSNHGISPTQLYIWSAVLIMSGVLYVFSHHWYFFGVVQVGMRIRIACSALLYKKSLKLSKASIGKSSVGQMVNLLSNDVNRYDLCVLFIHYLWVAPLQFILVSIITWYMVGISSMCGGAILLVFIPLQTWIGKQFSRLRILIAGKTDKRIRVMNEIIEGMKVIKMYAWEYPFMEVVNETRRDEIQTIKKTYEYKAFNLGFFFTSSRVVLLLIFFLMIIGNEVISSKNIFLIFGLFNTVRLSLTLFFPNTISMTSEALVSTDRIQNFLLLEEIGDICSSMKHEPEVRPEVSLRIEMKNVSGKWTSNEKDDDLRNVSFQVHKRELTAIIGPVGSGKSTILQALLGEFPVSSGDISIYGKISYASQEPWIFSGTIRQNILLGASMNHKRYLKVLKVCSLEHDLESWPDRDHTFVGEKGVALSGGQKARINLARSVYSEADVYLLDDPLSAVDSHVGRHLYEECIKNYLSRKTVILVTHQIQYLGDASNIILLNTKGEIEDQGTLNKLLMSERDFTSFLVAQEEETDSIFDEDELALTPKKSLNIENYMRRRQSSVSSIGSRATIDTNAMEYNDIPNEGRRTQTTESKVKGSISVALYKKYFYAGGGKWIFFFVYGLNILSQLLFVSTDWWLKQWTNAADARTKFGDISNQSHFFSNYANASSFEILPGFQIDLFNSIYYGIYFALVGALIICSQISIRKFLILCLKSSKNLHLEMFQKVIFTKPAFFDVNPVGRILNRFSKDIGSLDDLLPLALSDTSLIFLNAVGMFGLIISTEPKVLIPLGVILIILLILRKYYLNASRSVKRLEGITKSPVISQLSTTLNGISTIRASKLENTFSSEFHYLQDIHTAAFFSFQSVTRFFGFWVDGIVSVYVAATVVIFVFFSGDVEGGDIGISLSLSVIMAGMIQWGLRQSAEVENYMTSVERVTEYADLPSEKSLTSDKKIDPSWPNKGVIKFHNVKLKYDDQGGPYILKGLTFTINSFEKIGIIGRTGAGKSSMIAAIFRLVEPEGEIIIDGEDICQLGLHDIRKRISIIPQDPLLFSGNVRKNLDPIMEYEDSDLWNALEQAKLSQIISNLNGGLDAQVTDGGSNFSIGQRQLMCLARAILRKNRILIMDEATANVDPHTDSLIQEAIRTKFSKCTVLTIAHRLHTVMDSDRMLVLSDGRIEEFDEPHTLLQNEHNLISHLVEQTGPAMSEKLRNIAKLHFEERRNNQEHHPGSIEEDNLVMTHL